MTMIATFQGDRCILVATDLKTLGALDEQLDLPSDQRTYESFISEKFQPRQDGDWMVYQGKMTSAEYAILTNTSLETLKNVSMNNIPGIEKNRVSALFYVSVPELRLYAGDFNQPLKPAYMGQPIATSSDLGHVFPLMEVTQKRSERQWRTRKKLDKGFLRDLSRVYKEHFLSIGKKYSNIGGYAAYIISASGVDRITKKSGTLTGCRESFMDNDGRIYISEE